MYRRVAPLVLIALLATPAAAGPASPRASAVAIMVDTGQALLWDAERGEYMLVRAGDRFQTFFVVTVERGRVIVGENGAPEARHVLALEPAPTSVAGKRATRPATITIAEPEGGMSILDPYSDDQLEVVDPYGSRPSAVEPSVVLGNALAVPQVKAPPGSAIEDGPAAPAAPGAAPADPKPPAEGTEAGPRQDPPAMASKDVPQIRREAATTTRAELDATLADFDALEKEVQIEAADGGGVRILGLSRGSLFYRLGVRKGDVVRAVAGERLTGIEAAARVYARLQSVNRFQVDLDRAGARVLVDVTLR